MNITITKDQIQAGLMVVQNAVSSRSSLPILSNVLLKAEGELLELTASDLDMTVTCSVKAVVNQPGATTLPAKRLFQIIKEMPNSDLIIESDNDERCKIECGSIKFTIYGLSAADYPKLQTIKDNRKITIKQEKFRELLRRTSFAASQEEGRHLLNSVYVELGEHDVTVVATDGRRLVLAQEEMDIPEHCRGGIILPIRVVNEISRLLGVKGDVELTIFENFVRFVIRDDGELPKVLFTKLIEGSYPNYRQVVPKESKYRIELHREEFLSALKRAEIVTSERQSSVKLSFSENLMTVTTNTPEVGDFTENVAVKFNGEEFSIAFNPVYLIEPLSVLTEDVVYFELTDNLSPGVLKVNNPFLYVVMPLRLQE
ncbi:MAG: DNA polymerase III subunit beta [Verrucomicrobiia bacterium]